MVYAIQAVSKRHTKVVGCQPYAPPAFTPRKYSWYSFLLEAHSTPGPGPEGFYVNENPPTPAGIEPATFRFVAQHLDHCATAVPQLVHLVGFIIRIYFLHLQSVQAVSGARLFLALLD